MTTRASDAGALVSDPGYVGAVLGHRGAALIAVGLALFACEEPSAPPREDRPRAVTPAEEEVAEEAAPPVAWPTDVRGLREDVDAFTTVEACVTALRERTATAVAEGLTDLGYDGFFDDLCSGLAAVKAGSEEGCDARSISTARAGCRRRLAIVHARPEACPADRVTPGREPTCVAWASRDPDLCRASAESAQCRAVLEGGEGACARLRPSERERCRAHVQRYASTLGEERVASPAAAAPSVFTINLGGTLGGGAQTLERDVLERGVRVVPRGCELTIALANPLGEVTIPIGTVEPTFHLELAIPPGREAPIELTLGPSEAVLSVATPEHGGLTSIAGATGSVTLEQLELRRGGALRGTIEGTLRRGDGELAVRGRFATFIRDLEPLPPHCAAATE